MEDRHDQLAESFLAHELMNETADYVSRGRAHEILPTDQVEEGWIGAFRSWMKGASPREMDDFAAELRLRGLDTPNDRVRPEIEALQQRIKEAGPPPAKGPLTDKIDTFLRARDEPSN